MQFTIDNYTFDSLRLIVYSKDLTSDEISMLNETFAADANYEKVYTELAQQTPEWMKMDKIAIDSAGICLTYNCNLRCAYCAYSSTDTDENKLHLSDIEIFIKDIIKKRTIKKLITKQDKPLDIYFTGGGEPTFDWEVLTASVSFIEQQCKEKMIPLRLGITTNGILSDAKIEYIAKHFKNVMVSYDGLPEIQNRNRRTPNGKNTSNIVEHSICELANHNIHLTIRSTIWKNDFSKIRDMYEHICSLVFDRDNITWSIYPTLYEGRALEQAKCLDDRNFNEFLSYYADLAEYIISEKGYDKLRQIDTSIFNVTTCELFCGAYRINRPWLLPDGAIVTCIESKDFKTCIGKIDNGELRYFENYSDNLLKICQRKYTDCRDCIAYRFCRGGCPVWHHRMSSENDWAPECHLQKECWNYIIKATLTGKYSFGWRLEKIENPRIKNKEIYKLVHAV